jgi:hypothetical protein
MIFAHSQTVSYIVEYDKVSPYILPGVYVGVWSGKAVQVERSTSPSFLRLDDANRPQNIELPSEAGMIKFKRVN